MDSFVNYRSYHAVVCGYAKETTFGGNGFSIRYHYSRQPAVYYLGRN